MKIYYSFFFIFIEFSFQLKWSPNELSKRVKSWNYLNDPEELIADKKLGPKIHTTYLITNHVYDKTDVNLFYISDNYSILQVIHAFLNIQLWLCGP